MAELQISKRGIMELVAHEGIVLEAYLDSVRTWTWGIGVTNASGHTVYPRYLDNPQTLERVFEVFLWVLQQYEAAVLERFGDVTLQEHELAGAVSFHYNTGAIKTASWPGMWMSGDIEGARYHPTRGFMAWKSPPEIVPRRQAEADLFFDAKWTGTTTSVVYPVRKPQYTPDFGRGQVVDISDALDAAMDGEQRPDPVVDVDAIKNDASVDTAFDELIRAIVKAHDSA